MMERTMKEMVWEEKIKKAENMRKEEKTSQRRKER
jgi:hypothetical protein